MSTPDGDRVDAPEHPPPGVVSLDLRGQRSATTDAPGAGPTAALLRSASAAPGIRCLVLALDDTCTDLADDAVLAVAESSVPVVVTLRGALGGHAAALALAADVRLAATGVTVRVEPLVGGTSGTLPLAVGPAAARLLLLAPRAVDAQEALRIGLVHHVHDDAQLDASARELAGAVSRRAGVGAAVRRALSPEGNGVLVTRALEHEARLRQVVDLHPPG